MSEPNNENQNIQPPEQKPAGESKPPVESAAAIASSKESKRIKNLEGDISRLQKVLQDKDAELAQLQEITRVAATKPSPTTPGKSWLDEINDMIFPSNE